MFKILIKHIIYDRCVDVFFDKLTYNFIHLKYSKPKITMKSIHDIKSMHGVDLDDLLINALRDEISSSIDKNLINYMRNISMNNMNKTTKYYVDNIFH